MMKNLLIFGVILMLIGGIASLLLAITHAQAQQITQQPPFTQPQPQQPQMQQQIPQQQYPLQQQPPLQPQLGQGQPLYNPNQVIACLNHVLVDSMVKAGTTGSLTLHNNTKGVAPGLNQTFIQNATNTLDSCIIPMRR
jgi:glucose/arabinose dehydrogenase